MKVEKRIPFGFKGEWGKVFKPYTYDVKDGGVEYQQNNYCEIDSAVQFKYLENGTDRTVSTQPIFNLISHSVDRVVKTTDAYFDDNEKRFKCVISPNDIVFVFGSYWLVERFDERGIYTPNKQTFYYCGLKEISNVNLRSKGC